MTGQDLEESRLGWRELETSVRQSSRGGAGIQSRFDGSGPVHADSSPPAMRARRAPRVDSEGRRRPWRSDRAEAGEPVSPHPRQAGSWIRPVVAYRLARACAQSRVRRKNGWLRHRLVLSRLTAAYPLAMTGQKRESPPPPLPSDHRHSAPQAHRPARPGSEERPERERARVREGVYHPGGAGSRERRCLRGRRGGTASG